MNPINIYYNWDWYVKQTRPEVRETFRKYGYWHIWLDSYLRSIIMVHKMPSIEEMNLFNNTTTWSETTQQ